MPEIKQKIIQRTRSIERLLRRRKSMSISDDWVCQTYSSDTEECFFGYYDYSPFRPGTDQEFIYQSVPVGADPSACSTKLLFRSNSGDEINIGESNAWGWQIGSRLQWVDHNTVSAANHSRDRGYFTDLIDVQSGTVYDSLDEVFFDADFKASVGVSVDMVRLQKFRPGYGYVKSGLASGFKDEKSPAVWVTDLISRKASCLLTYQSARELDGNAIFSKRENTSYFNHVKLSPNADKCIVFHIVIVDGRRFNRCLIVDIASQDVRVLHDAGQVSHYCWLSNQQLLLTVGLSDRFDWRIIETDTGDWTSLDFSQFNLDGHPSLHPLLPEFILFDHYPNRLDERALGIFNRNSGEVETVGFFFSPPGLAGERKCDLHPRWGCHGESIAIDSAHDGSRTFNVLRRVKRCSEREYLG